MSMVVLLRSHQQHEVHMPLYHSQPFRADDANPKTPISIAVKQRPSLSVTRPNATGARGVASFTPRLRLRAATLGSCKKNCKNEPKLDPVLRPRKRNYRTNPSLTRTLRRPDKKYKTNPSPRTWNRTSGYSCWKTQGCPPGREPASSALPAAAPAPRRIARHDVCHPKNLTRGTTPQGAFLHD